MELHAITPAARPHSLGRAVRRLVASYDSGGRGFQARRQFRWTVRAPSDPPGSRSPPAWSQRAAASASQ